MDDWTLALGVLSAIFTFCILLTQVYSRVYIPREKAKETKRKEIYKPLLKDIDALIEKVRKKEPFNPPFNWKTVEEKVSAQLYRRLQNLFQENVDNYHNLLQHNKDFIRFKGYFFLNSQLSELQEEFHSLGVGGLEYELYNSIVTPILKGKKITLKWIEDNNPKLYEHLMKCQSYKKLKRLLDYLNKENPCIVPFRKAEQDLLQSAKELKNELKSF